MPHGAPTDGGQVGLVLLCLGSTAFGHPGEGPSRDLFMGFTARACGKQGLVPSDLWLLAWAGARAAVFCDNILGCGLPTGAPCGKQHSEP